MGRFIGLTLVVASMWILAAADRAGPVQDKAGGGMQTPPEPPPQPCFGQVISKPTGRNGYEDYVLAADVVIAPKVRQAEDALYALPSVLSSLAAKRAWVSAGRRALELVRIGNAKPIYDPRTKVDANTPFPEYVRFKEIAKLFAAEARVRFADDDPAGGTQSIVDCLTFSERIGHFNFIGSLVSIACTSITLAETEDLLRVLSQRDARALAAAADALLQKPTVLIDGIRAEQRRSDRFANAIAQMGEHRDETGDDSDAAARWSKFSAELRGLSPSQLQGLEAQVVGGINTRVNAILATLSGPESGWTVDEPADQPPADLAGFLTQISLPIYTPAMKAAARSRTQQRLLRLHGAIIWFLWEWNRLPKDLDELKSPALTDDPVAGKPYHYEVKGASAYDLWSDGWGDTGKIELRYRHYTGAGVKGDDPGIP